MAFLLRLGRKADWFQTEHATQLLRAGDVPSDALTQLATREGRLSVWRVSPDGSNVERLVRAIALTRSKPVTSIDWVMFDDTAVHAAGIEIDESAPGDSPDKTANTWHCDLTSITGNKLILLARAAFPNVQMGTVAKPRMTELIISGVASAEIELSDKRKKDLGIFPDVGS